MRRASALRLVVVSAIGLAGTQVTGSQSQTTSVPVSRDLVSFTLQVGQDTTARVGVLNGGMATVRVPGDLKIGLVPTINGSRVTLRVFEITATGGTSDGEAARYVSTTVLDRGQVARVTAGPFPFSIEWDATRPAGPEPPAGTEGPCTRCCVTCDDLTICACEVTHTCGSCCCVDCGGCGLRAPAGLASAKIIR